MRTRGLITVVNRGRIHRGDGDAICASFMVTGKEIGAVAQIEEMR